MAAAPAIAVALTAANTVLSGIARARANKLSAEQERRAARQAQEEAERAATELRRDSSAALASQRASSAGAGVLLQGSPLLVDSAGRTEALFQEADILAGGAARSNALLTSAAIDEIQGNTQLTEGFLRAGTTLLKNTDTFKGANKQSA